MVNCQFLAVGLVLVKGFLPTAKVGGNWQFVGGFLFLA
jgi:hypothetical protein